MDISCILSVSPYLCFVPSPFSALHFPVAIPLYYSLLSSFTRSTSFLPPKKSQLTNISFPSLIFR